MVAPYKLTPDDTTKIFLDSPACKTYKEFINFLSESVKGKVFDSETYSENIDKFLKVMDKLDSFIAECPLKEKSMSRFGNLSYRDWYSKMSDNAETFISSLFESIDFDTLQLLINYFKDSFGNCTRIDYGTGHELAFAFLLCCLFKLSYFKEEEADLVVLVVFKRYLLLVRNIQKTFSLEPAGSHGSWGLDDFQFLPYIFGASQMISPLQKFNPIDILNKDLCRKYSSDYMFFGCIDFIHQIKRGPFSEHSSILYSASQAVSWTKIYQSLNRMYVAEVLSKFPVIQHVWFGDLMPLYTGSV